MPLENTQVVSKIKEFINSGERLNSTAERVFCAGMLKGIDSWEPALHSGTLTPEALADQLNQLSVLYKVLASQIVAQSNSPTE